MRNTPLGLMAALTASIACGCGTASRESGAAYTGDSLVVAVRADEFGLALNRNRLGRYPLNADICEPLVRLTREFELAPGLASRWEYRGDNTYRFTLRSGPHFHDGRPLTSASVRYTLEQAIRDKTQYTFLSDRSVRIVDDSTVDIQPAKPNLRSLEQMVHLSYAIIADSSNGTVKPICTGPFRFREYVPGDHLTVDRNDLYWGEKAKLRSVTFRFIPDDNARALALRAGDVDVIFDVGSSLVASLAATPGFRVATSPPGAVILMYIATSSRPPYTTMSDPQVRRAVAMAIDRKSLVSHVMDGTGAVVSTVNPPSVLGQFASMIHGIPYDPAGSRRILDSAGWRLNGSRWREKGGSRLTLKLIAQPGTVDRAISQFVQANLAQVGIDVRIVELDAAAHESRLNSGAFDLDIEVPSQNDANPAFLLALRWYSKSTVRSARYMAAGSRFDSLVEKSLATLDRGESQKTGAEAMHLLIDQEVAAIPLAGVPRTYAMRNQVRGFVPHPSRLNQSWSGVSITR